MVATATMGMNVDADPTFMPLYAQVQKMLTQRIATGGWKPGQLLPSEFQLAAEYSVSQGTIRKALIALEVDKLITRRQGAGTYVAQHTSSKTLFQFFRLFGLDDARLTPTSVALQQRIMRATKQQANRLGVTAASSLHAITRVRSFNGLPLIFERIFVPVALMPGLTVSIGVRMTDEMYVIYQEHYGVTIARAAERLTAVMATPQEARLLGLTAGAPLLEINRVAVDINGNPVELRLSRCVTSSIYYAAEVI